MTHRTLAKLRRGIHYKRMVKAWLTYSMCFALYRAACMSDDHRDHELIPGYMQIMFTEYRSYIYHRERA